MNNTTPTVFNFEDVTTIINNNIEYIKIFKNIKDVNTRVSSILVASFYLVQARVASISLRTNDELSPTEIISLLDLDNKSRSITDEPRDPEFDRIIELIRICANTKDLNQDIWSKFSSELDINTILKLVNNQTDFDYEIFFPKQQRNISLAVKKLLFNFLYQAADQIEMSILSKDPESFVNKRNLIKAKLALIKSNEFIEEILDDTDRNLLVDIFKNEVSCIGHLGCFP